MEEIAVIKSTRIELGGLWTKKSKNGKTYLTGAFGRGGTIQVWPNTKREGMEGANDPDYTMVITEKYKKPTEKIEKRENEISEVPF